MVGKSMKRGYTKRRNTKRRYTKRRYTKRRYTKRRTKRRIIKNMKNYRKNTKLRGGARDLEELRPFIKNHADEQTLEKAYETSAMEWFKEKLPTSESKDKRERTLEEIGSRLSALASQKGNELKAIDLAELESKDVEPLISVEGSWARTKLTDEIVKIAQALIHAEFDEQEAAKEAARSNAELRASASTKKGEEGQSQVAPPPVGAVVLPPVPLDPQKTLSFNILNKFFKRVGGQGYKLTMPGNKINVISAHGISIQNQFFVIPEGLTLYLPTGSGDVFHSQPVVSEVLFEVDRSAVSYRQLQHQYIREYPSGSLIQDVKLKFKPFYDDEVRGTYRPVGLLNLEPRQGLLSQVVEKPDEAHKLIVDILSEGLKTKTPEEGSMDHDLTVNKESYFENNIDAIISKDELLDIAKGPDGIPLSEILSKIAKARKSDRNIPDEWFGTFCRTGVSNDINTFNECWESFFPQLPELPAEFFEGNFHNEGISPDLTRQKSLASNNPTINFKQILDEVYRKRGNLRLHEEVVSSIKVTLEIAHRNIMRFNKTISLREVCLVFQLKQQLIEQQAAQQAAQLEAQEAAQEAAQQAAQLEAQEARLEKQKGQTEMEGGRSNKKKRRSSKRKSRKPKRN